MPETNVVPQLMFTEAELDRVEDDLVLLLENCKWQNEYAYLRPSVIRKDLLKRGHTRVRIQATFVRLVKRGVFEVRDHEAAGVWPLEDKFFTTRDRWLAFAAQRGARRKPARRGRPRDTNVEADQRVYDRWQSGCYQSYQDLARELSQPRKQVAAAVDRHRKRKERERK
jgi:hypothetical protein